MITYATFFTLARMATTPFIVHAMVCQNWYRAFFLFLFAAVTDILDGFLARLLDEKTFLGACLDPIADKVLVLSVFFTLAFVQSPLFTIPWWFVALILLKELVLIVGVGILWLMHGKVEIRPSLLGKSTMALQIVFIAWLFSCYFFQWLPIKTYYTMLGVLLIVSGATLVQYAWQGFAYLFLD